MVKDACWLRPNNKSHINMAELDALTIEGDQHGNNVEHASYSCATDSLTVYRWVSDAISGRARLKTKAYGEM